MARAEAAAMSSKLERMTSEELKEQELRAVKGLRAIWREQDRREQKEEKDSRMSVDPVIPSTGATGLHE